MKKFKVTSYSAELITTIYEVEAESEEQALDTYLYNKSAKVISRNERSLDTDDDFAEEIKDQT